MSCHVDIMEKTVKRWLECDKDGHVRLETNYYCGVMVVLILTERKNERVMMPLVNRLVNESAKRERKERRNNERAAELQEKHGEAWSIPQYRLWARMEHNDQHNSLDVPPSIPMFNNTPSKPHRRDSLTNALTSAATAEIFKGSTATATASPGKRARVSGQYFEHLDKLSRLHKFCLM